MDIFVEKVANSETREEIHQIEREVFEQELGVRLSNYQQVRPCFQLLARPGQGEQPVGSLAVVDTTIGADLLGKCGLEIEPGKKIARYTRLAVRRPFRGLDIPLFLILEANRRFILPNKYDYSWLLFDEKRASSITLSTVFNLSPLKTVVRSEYGLCRVLLRNEQSATARAGNLQTARFLNNKQGIRFHPNMPEPAIEKLNNFMPVSGASTERSEVREAP
jgi:hypothetical protein